LIVELFIARWRSKAMLMLLYMLVVCITLFGLTHVGFALKQLNVSSGNQR